MKALYHYTTGAGLLGMLKDYSVENPNLTMWATHHMYMNDPIEYIYGRNICLDIIDEIENDLNINENNKIKRIVITKEYQDALRIMLRTPEVHSLCPYITSFSYAEDSLHMWNMYATNGNGLAIKFNTDKLVLSRLLLKDCVYLPNQDIEVQTQLKQEIKKLYLELSADRQYETTFSSIHPLLTKEHYIFTLICLHFGVRIKNSAYNMEVESRKTIISKGRTVLFRERNGIIIPYLEDLIPFDCVDGIIVGPTADFNRVRESILLLMNNRGIIWDEDKILKSNVPYRE